MKRDWMVKAALVLCVSSLGLTGCVKEQVVKEITKRVVEHEAAEQREQQEKKEAEDAGATEKSGVNEWLEKVVGEMIGEEAPEEAEVKADEAADEEVDEIVAEAEKAGETEAAGSGAPGEDAAGMKAGAGEAEAEDGKTEEAGDETSEKTGGAADSEEAKPGEGVVSDSGDGTLGAGEDETSDAEEANLSEKEERNAGAMESFLLAVNDAMKAEEGDGVKLLPIWDIFKGVGSFYNRDTMKEEMWLSFKDENMETIKRDDPSVTYVALDVYAMEQNADLIEKYAPYVVVQDCPEISLDEAREIVKSCMSKGSYETDHASYKYETDFFSYKNFYIIPK